MPAVVPPVAQPAQPAQSTQLAPSSPPAPLAPVAEPQPPTDPAPAPVSLTAATVVDLSATSAVVVAAPPKHTVSFNELPAALAAQIAVQPSATAQPLPPEQAPIAPPAQSTAPEHDHTAPALLSEPVQPVPLVAQSAAIPLVAAPVVRVVAAAPEAEPPSVTSMVVAPSQPPPAKPSQPPTKPSAPPPPQQQSSLAHAVASASTSGPHGAARAKTPVRHRGDDLLSEAFDALSDMAFLTDSPQAVDFAAQVAKDLLHTPFVVISLYDIDKHEIFVEFCEAAPSAKGRRLKVAKGETRSDVMLRGLPVASTRWEPDPYLAEAPIGPALFVSIALDRRLFGLIEIHREVGEHGFEHDEEGAASYIASQLAQFLADQSKRVGFREEPEASRRK
jgi:hypothetical protein